MELLQRRILLGPNRPNLPGGASWIFQASATRRKLRIRENQISTFRALTGKTGLAILTVNAAAYE